MFVAHGAGHAGQCPDSRLCPAFNERLLHSFLHQEPEGRLQETPKGQMRERDPRSQTARADSNRCRSSCRSHWDRRPQHGGNYGH